MLASEGREIRDRRNRYMCQYYTFLQKGIISQLTKLRTLKTQLELQVEAQKTEIQDIQNAYTIERRQLQQEAQDKMVSYHTKLEELSTSKASLLKEKEKYTPIFVVLMKQDHLRKGDIPF